MCIRVQYAPCHEIVDPWDREQNLITLPAELSASALFAMRAARALLLSLGVEQGVFGARCWCGEDIDLTAPIQQQPNSEVLYVKTKARPEAGRYAS
ncbi:hypothetical protein [Streptomyces pseudogriseolus]|uniref:hypothetical protein n=1 Tax=Streptomyces pseudogriseolus TaxID=36817 RepID=UPI003FA1FDB2